MCSSDIAKTNIAKTNIAKTNADNGKNILQKPHNKIKLIFDCDNTMGMPNKDVDDGLTLLYLLGRQDIELLCVTLTYGNSSLKNVIAHTTRLCKDLHIDTPLYHGAEAAKMLAQHVARAPQEISILATGSLSNLHEASKLDKNFFSLVKNAYIMGGIVKPLRINGKKVNELNFSVNATAAATVLNAPMPISLLNGHLTADAMFGKAELLRLHRQKGTLFRYIEKSILPWVSRMKKELNLDGFSNWDVAAAMYISHPELFEHSIAHIAPSAKSLASGNIMCVTPHEKKSHTKEIIMPSAIKDLSRFNDILFEAWQNFQDTYLQ